VAADAEAALKTAGCTRRSNGAEFTCTARAGFDRCESVRRQRKVASCVLGGRS
jgi:hypothetical protein